MSESRLACPVWTGEPQPVEAASPSRPDLRVVKYSPEPPKLRKRRRPVGRIIVNEGPFRLFKVW